MGTLTRLQVLEKQKKDLQTRLENREGKAGLALVAAEDEIKSLSAQLRANLATIAMLQSEIARLTRELEAAKGLQEEDVRARIDAAVAEAAAPLMDEISKAHIEISRLKAIINKDSTNSSKPPGKNGFKKIPNSREPSGKPRGGQKGHPGHRLGLPENMDELVEKGIIKKHVIDHTGGSAEYISRYVIDVEVTTTITEHRYAIDAQLPENHYNEVSYGDKIKAMSVLMLNEGIIAELRFSEMLEGLTQGVVTISPATLEKFNDQFAGKLESSGEIETIEADLLNDEVMHVDDTPLRCAETVEYLDDGTEILQTADGTSFSATVRVYCNETTALYTVNPKKDDGGVKRDGILPRFFGIVSQDHESKFYKYGTLNATCCEHLVRDLKGIRDLQMIPWAGDMRAFILSMNNHKKRDLEKEKTECDPDLLAGFERTYDGLLKRGRGEFALKKEGDFGYDEFRKMLNRLTDYKDNYLLFMRNYKAPFTNNLAERDLRPEKTKEKVSLLFRSWKGIENHVRIRSFISTAKKRGMDLYSAITNVTDGVAALRKA
jgi:hypothetical protein